MPTTVEALTIAVFFLVPGFLAEWVLDRFTVRRGKSDFQRVLSALTVSGLVWIVPGPFIYRYWQAHHAFWSTYVLCALLILLAPPVMAYVVAKHGTRVRAWLQGVLHLPLLDSRPTAWDSVFSSCEGRWVIVHTTDGETYGGIYGLHSYAGSHPDHDLFLEQLWWLDDTRGFVEQYTQSAGVYFPAATIRYVEFCQGTGGGQG